MHKLTFGLAAAFLSIGINCYANEVPGLYFGMGGSWNTVDESFDSTFISSAFNSSHDHYNATNSRLSPMVQIGYWAPIQSNWLWGVSAQWSYLGYKTENVNGSRGQYIPNASFSSINFFGPKVIRDFSSQTRINNEALFLAFLGMQAKNGYVYVGLGPTILTAANRITISSIHTPDGTGDNLTSGSINASQTMWGGVAQVGYNYFLEPTIFFSVNYSYLLTGTHHSKNSINTAIFNGFNTAGPTTLNLNRSIQVRVQEFMFSINKVFC